MSFCTTSGLLLAGFLSLQSGRGVAQEDVRPRLEWSDFDRDGRVDLFSVDPFGLDLLLRNTGDGRFDDVTADLALPQLTRVRSAAFGDHDGDGWPDLFLLDADGQGRLMRNHEGRIFEDVTAAVGLQAHPLAEEARWEDFDADGQLDLFLSGTRGDALLRNEAGRFGLVELPRLLVPGPPVPELPLLAGGALVFTESVQETQEVIAGSSGRGGGGGRGNSAHTAFGAGAGIPGFGATAPGPSQPAGPTAPTPTPGGSSPILLNPEIPSGFSILGEVGAPAPLGFEASGEVIAANGDRWFVEELPQNPGPDDSPESRVMPGGSVAIDMSGLEKLFVFGGTNGTEYRVTGFKFDAEAPRNQVPSQQWAPIADMPPPARGAIATVTVDNQIYAIGGRDDMNSFTDVDVYNPMLDMWTQATGMTLPTPVHGAGAAAIGRRIYLFGGNDPAGGILNRLLVFDLDMPLAGWVPLTPGGIAATPRQFPVVEAFQGKLYAIGGFDGTAFTDVTEEFDPVLGRWERRAPRPIAFQGAFSTVANGELHVFGGENMLPFGDVHTYDSIEDRWMTRENMLTPRSHGIAGRLCKSSYVVGGLDDGTGQPMMIPAPVPVNEEYLENQNEKAVYTKM